MTAVSILSLVILLLLILVCIYKQRRTKGGSETVTHTDLNPTYGDYVDPDPTVEVEDTNDYYSSDYEAGTSRMTDNNPYYGM